MRLLSTNTEDGLRLQDFVGEPAPYAILSHKWKDGEVSYQDVAKYDYAQHPGFGKLIKACERAALDGFEWIWVDTCCIDKSSSAELSEAINSMYDWYARAVVCYALLDDYDEQQGLARCRWFSRGWTLQELIAPKSVEFYDSAWQEIGTKRSLRDSIASITGINMAILDGAPPSGCTYAERMSWMCGRRTTREEDMAYCLLGLCNVNMPLLYGEGAKKAFFRLQAEILSATEDHTLLMWDHRALSAVDAADYGDTILAPEPWLFKRAGNLSERQYGRNEQIFDYSKLTVENAVEYRSKWIQSAAKANISAGTLNIRPQELGLQAWVADIMLEGSTHPTPVAILNAWVGERAVVIRLEPHEHDKSGRHYRRGPGPGFELASQQVMDGLRFKQMRLRSISLYPARLATHRSTSLPQPSAAPAINLYLETLSLSSAEPYVKWHAPLSTLPARYGSNDRGVVILRFDGKEKSQHAWFLVLSLITEEQKCWIHAEILSSPTAAGLVQVQKAQLQSTERGVPVDPATGLKWTDRATVSYAGKSLRCAIRCLSSPSQQQGAHFQIRVLELLQHPQRNNGAENSDTDAYGQSIFGALPMIYDGDAWTWVDGGNDGNHDSTLERAESPSILLGQPRTEYPLDDRFELPIRRFTDESLNGKATMKRTETLGTNVDPSVYDPSSMGADDSRTTAWPEDHLARVVRAREIAHKLAKRAKKQGVHGMLAEASSLVQSNLGPSSFGINSPPSNILGGSVGPWGPSNSDTLSTVSGSSHRSKLKARKEEKRDLKEMKKLARSQTQPIPEHSVLSPQRSYPPQPSYAMQQWYQSQDFPPPTQSPSSQGANQVPPSPQQTHPTQPQQYQQHQQQEQQQQPMRHAPPIPDGEPPPYQELNNQHSF